MSAAVTTGPARLAGRAWQPLVILLLILAAPQLAATPVFPLLVLAGIYGIALIGVSVLAGLGGQVTLGHAAFVAVGAYASALGTTTWGLPPLVGVLVGVAGALLLALTTSPILRLRGWYLAMATIAVAAMLQQVLVNLGPVTGGNDGVYGIRPLSVGGLRVVGETQYFVLAWTLVLVFLVLGGNIVRSRYGRSLAAVHKDVDAAAALGIDPTRAKTVLWLVASVPAAIAGSVFAHYSAFIAPSNFGFSLSLALFAAVVIGGERSIFAGLVVLTLVTTLAAVATRTITVELLEAVAMLVVYLASPRGLAGIGAALARAIGPRVGRHA